jgi:feruloyl esterase
MAGTNGRAFRLWLFASGAMALITPFCSPAAWAAGCEDLMNIKLADTTIVSAEAVPAGDLTTADKVTRKAMPAFCRVVASVEDASDSDVRVELWMPNEGWKGVFHLNGNGGYAGVLGYDYGAMEAAIKHGYASAITDLGTAPATPLDGDAVIGHPQKWKDWGMLGTHEAAVVGKQIAKAFYGADAKRSYYTGCSTGGQQGLIEAEYFPEDFDGILAGAPVVNRTWVHAVMVTSYQAAHLKPERNLSAAKLALITKSAVAACGANGNGLKSDPFIADPLACNFDPASLTCKGAAGDDCLTPEEVETAKAIYLGPADHNGKPLFYGIVPGSESGVFNWGFIEAPANSPSEPAFGSLFKWAFGANWNWRTFDVEQDMVKVDATLGSALNGAVSGDVSKFHDRGGKLILFQGWADPIVPVGETVDFYKALMTKFGGEENAKAFARLFMVPDIGHCGIGGGLNGFDSSAFGGVQPPAHDPEHDMFAALSHWVEDGVAPEQVIATKYVDNDSSKGIAMQRPLCPYPQKAWYKGAGDTNQASNFTCAVAKP